MVVVVVFGAEDSVGSAPVTVKLSGRDHRHRWCQEVDPGRRPDARRKSGATGACRIHAHSGQRGFESGEGCYEQTGCNWRESGDGSRVRDHQHRGHHEKRDHRLRYECHVRTAYSGYGYDVVDSGVP